MKRRKKAPDNYLPVTLNGTALWEVWHDEGDGTPAEPALYDSARRLYLNDESAGIEARRLAEANPSPARFAIKCVDAVASSEIVKESRA